MEKQLPCSDTCPQSHLSKSLWACKHAEIIHAIAADTKKIKMLKKYREISRLLGEEKGCYEGRGNREEKQKQNHNKLLFFFLNHIK